MLYTALALLTAVNGRIAEDLLSKVKGWMKLRDDGDCYANNQCYFGSDASECCAGHVITDITCSSELSCDVCEPAVNLLIGLIDKLDCDQIASTENAEEACTDLGVPSSMSSFCAMLLKGACDEIDKLLKQDITDASAVCMELGFCASDGNYQVQGASPVFGVSCGCVNSGDCTFYEEGCCSGTSSWVAPWDGCIAPLSKCD